MDRFFYFTTKSAVICSATAQPMNLSGQFVLKGRQITPAISQGQISNIGGDDLARRERLMPDILQQIQTDYSAVAQIGCARDKRAGSNRPQIFLLYHQPHPETSEFQLLSNPP